MRSGEQLEFDKVVFATPPDQVLELLEDPSEVELTTGAPIRSLDDVKRLEDLGITRVVGGPPGFSPDDLERGLEKLGDDILSKL